MLKPLTQFFAELDLNSFVSNYRISVKLERINKQKTAELFQEVQQFSL